MAPRPVEWVLVVYYGPEAHRATYGRQVQSPRYTKDYIQLSRRREFLDAVTKLFCDNDEELISVPLDYRWTYGNAIGALTFSSDRPHLKWETSVGPPQVWKMSLTPSEDTSETIPGDPSHLGFDAAEDELALLANRGAGQPYLMAIKLRDEQRTLHLRAYLNNPSADFTWANIQLVPEDIQTLAAQTSQQSALAWSSYESGGIAPTASIQDVLLQLSNTENTAQVFEALGEDRGHALLNYLRRPGHGLFFDPTRNHDAWFNATPLSEHVAETVGELLDMLEVRYSDTLPGDAAAELSHASPEEVDAFRKQIEHEDYGVADSHATSKTRGSAQRAFAAAVKKNYGFKCAVTGINTGKFLVASHIVPWSKDQSIRLDPSNGICLSLLVDRAFEVGYLLIEDDLAIRIDWDRVGDDQKLRSQLEPYDGQKLIAPSEGCPKVDYLQRRRVLVAPS